MDWQLIAVILTIAAAIAYLARSAFLAWTGTGKGCGSSCGQCKTAAPEETAADARRIRLPQVTVKD
ncbi:hypothetical protein [Tuwongella immobilis]|uniref:FeoB-associated Cys-rich membrane protein n=1 Tax=Tuwongella immobilis TaxID=692036 RepID=A0A6C2YPH8_9BACT|nr:hypothetical protein [Tuwongella immobilis]VIP03033.1 unnamed protein product [Tuwongella immobilis]VTS03187.1 unnamed protein product [Tuwongella immobilis]